MLNSFSLNNSKILISTSQLNNSAKKVLYSKFFFYNLDLLFFERRSPLFITSKKSIPFKEVLSNDFFLYQFTSKLLYSLSRARIIAVTNSFLYFDVGGKYTVLKPKFKVFFPSVFVGNLLQKEILLFNHMPFLSFLKLKNLKKMLKPFQLSSSREDSSLNFNSMCSTKYFYFKKLIYLHKFFKQYFFYQLFKSIFSNSQKRMTFLQFNIFFKKYINT